MAVELATQYSPAVDEMFTTESKLSLLTNNDYSWAGAHAVRVYKVSTASMNDYGRGGPDVDNWSRYGDVQGLNATTQLLTLGRDRAFTFALDALDMEETVSALRAASALARQIREVVIPEVDTYVYAAMCSEAGAKPDPLTLSATNIYGEILNASLALDDAEVPETNRVLVVTPAVYALMKKSKDIVMETDIGMDMRLRGVISNLDGMNVIRVPTVRLPAGFGFLLCHPSATVSPVKLESYKTHQDPPGISGALVEGRIVYDAFVLENKAKALYYQAQSGTTP